MTSDSLIGAPAGNRLWFITATGTYKLATFRADSLLSADRERVSS